MKPESIFEKIKTLSITINNILLNLLSLKQSRHILLLIATDQRDDSGTLLLRNFPKHKKIFYLYFNDYNSLFFNIRFLRASSTNLSV